MSHLYLNDHDSQYDEWNSDRTKRDGCTWTSGANGADASTGGKRNPNPDQVLAKVARHEETSPSTPGWSMTDLALAMTRLGIGFRNGSGGTWSDVVGLLDAGYYVTLQGDSDQFGNATCSGQFDGDHCIGIHPYRESIGQRRQRIDDPICPAARLQTREELRQYAEKLARKLGEYPRLRYGYFTTKVPRYEWRVRVSPMSRFLVYTVKDGRIVSRRNETTLRGFSAGCTEPDRYPALGLPQPSYELVKLTTGSRAGKYIGAQYAREMLP